MVKTNGNQEAVSMRIILKFLLIAIAGLLISKNLPAQTIKVGFEAFPPLITSDLKGYTIDMLRAIEKISDLEFDIKIMPYNRAKLELEKGEIGLMGHTPKGMEVKEFYGIAQELKWSIPTRMDFYSKYRQRLNDPKRYKIGTPRGNAAFTSEVLSLPLGQFYETKLENLLRMLIKDRDDVQVVVFERATTMSTIRHLKLQGIYYKNVGLGVKAGLAVAKTNTGDELKHMLEKYIALIDLNKIFSDFYYYVNLPNEGKVSW